MSVRDFKTMGRRFAWILDPGLRRLMEIITANLVTLLDHGNHTNLGDDTHLQYVHKDITRHLTVGYTTDIEADDFTDPLEPDFQLEYLKTMTVTADFTLNMPTGNGHGEYYLTVDSGGPYTLTAGANVTMIDSNVTLLDSESYILNIHRYSDTNTVAQLLQVSAASGSLIVENEGSPLATPATTLDFVGAGVDATGTGAEKTITISGTDNNSIHNNVDAEISAITAKTTPVGADFLLIEDSAASNAKKSLTLTNLFGNIDASDPDAIHDNASGEISAITGKATPVGADYLVIEDSADSDAKKSITLTNLFGNIDANDSAAIHDNVANEIKAITDKPVPVSGDHFVIEDSADSDNKKSLEFSNLKNAISLFIDVVLVEQADTPYAMTTSDQLIVVKPNDGATVRVDLIPGVNGRSIRIKNIKTGAAATAAIYSDAGDLLQLAPGTDPSTTGPYNLSKGQTVDFVYLSDFGAWGIM